MEIALATREDAEEIVALVRLAFAPVATEYGMDTLPPLNDTPEALVAHLETHVVLKAVEAGRVVGSVRGVMTGGTCEVGRLVVHPEHAGNGIGSELARAIEGHFPDARRFELFTGHNSGPSLHIYRKLGYVPYRTEQVSDTLTLVYLEKSRRRKVRGHTK